MNATPATDFTSTLGFSEDEIDIEGKPWDHDDCHSLWARKMAQAQYIRDYWRFFIDRGHQLEDFYGGKIFSDDERAYLEDIEDKVVVEPRLMKGPIRALVGQMIKSRKSGSVVSEAMRGESAAVSAEEGAVVDVVIKKMEQATDEKYKLRDALHDSCVACYPSVLLYDLAGPGDSGTCGKYKLTSLPWDSCAFGPINLRQVSDIAELLFTDRRSIAELIENFPDMEEQIIDHFNCAKMKDSTLLSSIRSWAGAASSSSSEERDRMFDILSTSVTGMNATNGGTIPVYQHIFPIRKKHDVWVNIFDQDGNDYVVRPETWEDERWAIWQEDNKDRFRGPYPREVRILWSTTFTTTGLVLENKQHWFQDGGRGPWAVVVPAFMFGEPTGPADDLADDTKSNAVAETEFLDDLRKGSGKLLVMKEGTIANVKEVPQETAKAVGTVFVKAEYSIEESFKEVNRQSNKSWGEYAQMRRGSMADTTRINEAMQGASEPRQSAVAKQMEISAALISNAIYIDNFNQSWEQLQNLKLSIMPLVFDEHEVIEILDEKTNQTVTAEVNAEQHDPITGEVTHVVNDIRARRYRWKIKPVDDSESAKTQALQEALVFINAASGPLIHADPSGKFFARVLVAMPNIFLNEAGRALATDAKEKADAESAAQQQDTMAKAKVEMMKAQAALEKAKKAGVTATFSGADLEQYPNLLGVLMALQGGSQNVPQITAQPQPVPAAPAQPMAPQQPIAA